MKRWLGLLLALAMLLSVSAWGEEDDLGPLAEYESPLGFTVWYDDSLVGVLSGEDPRYGLPCDLIYPLDAEANAGMTCAVLPDMTEPNWEAEGWVRVEMDEWDLELSTSMGMSCRVFQSQDGRETVEDIRLFSPVGGYGWDGGYTYMFTLRFPSDDPDSWRETLEDLLAGAYFPPQGFEVADFRVDFFQGGAAGMRFIDVTVDEDAEPIVLLPLREMKDAVLEWVEWDETGMEAAGTETLYAAALLSPGDNLRIACYFSDMMPNLRFRYVDAEGEEMTWYLADSGMDGSLLILSPYAL